MPNLNSILDEVIHWPPQQRLALATKLLQSLQREEGQPMTQERREALLSLIGIWKMDNPPSDEQVEQTVEQERMRKYL